MISCVSVLMVFFFQITTADNQQHSETQRKLYISFQLFELEMKPKIFELEMKPKLFELEMKPKLFELEMKPNFISF